MKQAEIKLRKTLQLENAKTDSKNYSIVAGAGAGKTTLLSSRIASQILSGIPIERFVIITYTNAGAMELREKISHRLRQLQKEEKDPAKKGYLEHALNNIELIQISTIHSFLLKILRESSFASKVALDAKLLEENEVEEMKQAFFEEWYLNHFDDFRSFQEAWTIETKEGKPVDHTKEVFERMFMDLAEIREEVVFDTSDHEKEFTQIAKDYSSRWFSFLVDYKNAIYANQPINKDGTKKELNKPVKSFLDNLQLVEQRDPSVGSIIEDACHLSQAIQSASEIKNYYNRYNEVFEELDAFQEQLEEMLAQDVYGNFHELYEKKMKYCQSANQVVEYVLKMRDAYQAENQANPLSLTNNDILYRTEKLLMEYPDILDTYRNRFDKIYVDEFQDTTLTQTNIVKMLVGKVGTAYEADDFEEGKLVVVGDPKQSIYRFTGAEIAVYEDLNHLLEESLNSEVVQLNSNFRSNQDVIDWVNDRFAKTLKDNYQPMDTDWVVLDNNALHGVFGYEPMDDKYKVDDDVLAVVELINRLVDNKDIQLEEIVNRETDERKLRKIRYSDIMVLTKVANNIGKYVKELNVAGIPVDVQGKFHIHQNEVVKNYLLLINYLANPKNTLYYYEALQVIGGVEVGVSSREEIEEASQKLQSLQEEIKTQKLGPSGIAEFLLQKEELYLKKEKTYSKEEIREYRIHLHQMVETCIARQEGDFKQLVEELWKYYDEIVKKEILLESNEDAVRLMNVHQAKGLTAQIVIIADRSRKEKVYYSGYKKRGKYYPSIAYSFGPKTNAILCPTYIYDKIAWETAYLDEKAEATRLEYVAATRGAHALIFMPAIEKDAWFSNPEYQLDLLPDINTWLNQIETGKKKKQSKKPSKQTQTFIRQTDLETALSRVGLPSDSLEENPLSLSPWISITPSSLEKEGVTGYTPEEAGYEKEDRPSGNVLGTIMHRIFELAVMDPEDFDVESIVNRAIGEHIDELEKKEKVEVYQNFLQPILTAYQKDILPVVQEEAEEIYPEYHFSFFVEGKEKDEFESLFHSYFQFEIQPESQGYWVNGTSDLVTKRKDGTIKVYDYKSDTRNGKPLEEFQQNLQEKYEGQLLLYRYAMAKLFDQDIDKIETEIIDLYSS